MLDICKATNRGVASREGTLHYCEMHLFLSNGKTINLRLGKDDRRLVHISYRPGDIELINKESEELSFLFSE